MNVYHHESHHENDTERHNNACVVLILHLTKSDGKAISCLRRKRLRGLHCIKRGIFVSSPPIYYSAHVFHHRISVTHFPENVTIERSHQSQSVYMGWSRNFSYKAPTQELNRDTSLRNAGSKGDKPGAEEKSLRYCCTVSRRYVRYEQQIDGHEGNIAELND